MKKNKKKSKSYSQLIQVFNYICSRNYFFIFSKNCKKDLKSKSKLFDISSEQCPKSYQKPLKKFRGFFLQTNHRIYRNLLANCSIFRLNSVHRRTYWLFADKSVLYLAYNFLKNNQGSIPKPVGKQKLSINISQSKKEKFYISNASKLRSKRFYFSIERFGRSIGTSIIKII